MRKISVESLLNSHTAPVEDLEHTAIALEQLSDSLIRLQSGQHSGISIDSVVATMLQRKGVSVESWRVSTEAAPAVIAAIVAAIVAAIAWILKKLFGSDGKVKNIEKKVEELKEAKKELAGLPDAGWLSNEKIVKDLREHNFHIFDEGVRTTVRKLGGVLKAFTENYDDFAEQLSVVEKDIAKYVRTGDVEVLGDMDKPITAAKQHIDGPVDQELLEMFSHAFQSVGITPDTSSNGAYVKELPKLTAELRKGRPLDESYIPEVTGGLDALSAVDEFDHILREMQEQEKKLEPMQGAARRVQKLIDNLPESPPAEIKDGIYAIKSLNQISLHMLSTVTEILTMAVDDLRFVAKTMLKHAGR